MNISNVRLNGKITNIITENGSITDISDHNVGPSVDAGGLSAIPGLIDVHIHGYMGHDTMDCNFAPLSDYLAKNGTTAYLPTTMTADNDSLSRVCNSHIGHKGASILGFHLEGPYISKAKKGAQNEKYIRNPDIAEFRRFNNVKMITVAPELEGCTDFIKSVSADCVVSIGHTAADYNSTISAIENGAKCLTHTYNAMPQFINRNPGPIGAAFERGIYAQLICDGLHVSKSNVLALYKMFTADRTVLISDSIRPAGLPEGKYESGGLDVYIKDGEARLGDGTLAGGGKTLLECVKKAVQFGIPFEDAVKMATKTPAELLGLKSKGEIKPGYDADILLLDDEMKLKCVIIKGEIYENAVDKLL